MSLLCLSALGGAVLARLALPDDRFLLSWVHSVEKVEWQEEWRGVGGRLVLDTARVMGSGAGMEPGPDAVLENGWWRWHPALPPQARLVLAESGTVPDHRLCVGGTCRAMSEIVGRQAVVVVEMCGVD